MSKRALNEVLEAVEFRGTDLSVLLHEVALEVNDRKDQWILQSITTITDILVTETGAEPSWEVLAIFSDFVHAAGLIEDELKRIFDETLDLDN